MAPPSLRQTAPPVAICSPAECRWRSVWRTCARLSVVMPRRSLQSVDKHKGIPRSVNLQSGGNLCEACYVYDPSPHSVITNRRQRSMRQARSRAGSASPFLCANFPCSIVACVQFGTSRNILQLNAPARPAWAVDPSMLRCWILAAGEETTPCTSERQSLRVSFKIDPKRKRLRDDAM